MILLLRKLAQKRQIDAASAAAAVSMRLICHFLCVLCVCVCVACDDDVQALATTMKGLTNSSSRAEEANDERLEVREAQGKAKEDILIDGTAESRLRSSMLPPNGTTERRLRIKISF